MIALNQHLAEAKERLRKCQWLRETLFNAEKDLDSQRARFVALDGILQKEQSDVGRLENVSLTGLFYAAFGTKEQQLEKERQELLLARLKFDECKEAIAALESEVTRLKLQIEELGDVEARLTSLIAEKERAILQGNDDNAKKLTGLTEELADTNSDLREVQEAIAAGETALRNLNDTISSLGSARGWGTWDMLGGGLLATAVKHHRIDQARDAAHRAQQSLRLFVHELRDVDQGLSSDLDIEIGSFLSFADYFFDNLIVDWVVQARIKLSEEKTVVTRDRLQSLVSRLNDRKDGLQGRLRAIEEERRALIEQVQ